MPKLTISRTGLGWPSDSEMAVIRRFLFQVWCGFTDKDQKRWMTFWGRLKRAKHGEMFEVITWVPRNPKFHSYHMAMLMMVWDSQEVFAEFEDFRDWVKIGAGWVTWLPHPHGGDDIPKPRSISWAKADENQAREAHDKMLGFLHTNHAAAFLWPHLDPAQAQETMRTILEEFAQ